MSGMLFRWDKWLTRIASDWQGPSAQPGVPTESGCGKLGHRPITLADLERKNPFRKRVGKGNTAEKEAEKPQPLRVEVSWFKATPRSTLPDFERVFEEHMTEKPHISSELHCTTTKTAMRVLLLRFRSASVCHPPAVRRQPSSRQTLSTSLVHNEQNETTRRIHDLNFLVFFHGAYKTPCNNCIEPFVKIMLPEIFQHKMIISKAPWLGAFPWPTQAAWQRTEAGIGSRLR